MEDLREVQAVMEKEIQKGRACRLEFDELGFPEDMYQRINSAEQLDKVIQYLLRMGEFKGVTNQAVINNVYLDEGKSRHDFHRTWTSAERKKIYRNIQRRIKHLKPDYEGKCYVESIRCYFTMDPGEMQKWTFTYEGKETYAFLLSDTYIRGLFTYCEAARKFLGEGDVDISILPIEHLDETEKQMLTIRNVRNAIFQALMLDDVRMDGERMYANLHSIYVLE